MLEEKHAYGIQCRSVELRPCRLRGCPCEPLAIRQAATCIAGSTYSPVLGRNYILRPCHFMSLVRCVTISMPVRDVLVEP
eukprot:5856184-Amphidinium_carterae.1